MSIQQHFFRHVMGHFATGVSIVTTSSQGEPGGLTVNAFCSVSLDPPLVLVCVDLNSATLPMMRESGIFAVNILTSEQEEYSRCFATSSAERYERFCDAPYHTAATGAPILDGALAFIDAHIVAEYPGGDHAIFVGQVEALGVSGTVHFASDAARELATLTATESTVPADLGDDPLAYYRGQYRHLASSYRAPSLPPVTSHENRRP